MLPQEFREGTATLAERIHILAQAYAASEANREFLRNHIKEQARAALDRGGWIALTDRKPTEADGQFLVWSPVDGNVETATAGDEFFGHGYTHWRPLPPPPATGDAPSIPAPPGFALLPDEQKNGQWITGAQIYWKDGWTQVQNGSFPLITSPWGAYARRGCLIAVPEQPQTPHNERD